MKGYAISSRPICTGRLLVVKHRPFLNKRPDQEGKEIVLNYLTPHNKWSVHSMYFDSLPMLTLFRGGPTVWMNKDDAEETQQANLLAKLGHHIAEARLESPNQIMTNYLIPAIDELKNNKEGKIAGQVYHRFASFCHDQLQNADISEDLTRVAKIQARRQAEVEALTTEVKGMKAGHDRKARESELSKSKRW